MIKEKYRFAMGMYRKVPKLRLGAGGSHGKLPGGKDI